MTERAILDGDEQSHAVLWNGLSTAIEMVALRNQQSGVSTAIGMLYALRLMLMKLDEKAARELLRALAAMENEADAEKCRKIAHKLYKAADALAEREGAQIQ